MLADSVERTHFGRAYGLERAGDMLGAVAGPLVATLFIWMAVDFHAIILWTLIPGLLAAASIFFLARDRQDAGRETKPKSPTRRRFPRPFWLFLFGVFLFGLGDFSRTFLIWLGVRALGGENLHLPSGLSVAVLLYAMHNLTAALSAYPVGHLGDRTSKMRVLVGGYALGAGTNLLLALIGGSLPGLVAAIVMSGIYISIEETLEKAVAAELLPTELRSLGFGILASVNAVGDVVSSVYVGFLLEHGHQGLAFGLAAGFGVLGVLWMLGVVVRKSR